MASEEMLELSQAAGEDFEISEDLIIEYAAHAQLSTGPGRREFGGPAPSAGGRGRARGHRSGPAWDLPGEI